MNLPSSDLEWTWVLEFVTIYFFCTKLIMSSAPLGGVRWWLSSWPALRYQCVGLCPASRECDGVGIHVWPWSWKFENIRRNLSKRLMLPWNLSPHFLKNPPYYRTHWRQQKSMKQPLKNMIIYVLRLARHFFQVWVIDANEIVHDLGF